MTDTQWYMTTDIIQGGKDLKQRFSNGLSGWIDYATQASEFRFRDEQGTYWFHDALQGYWYRFEGQDWHRAQSAPDHLEGLATIANSLGMFSANSLEVSDPFAGQENMPAQSAYETLIAARRKDFAQGKLSSLEIEQMLARLLLLDKQGGFWTIGFRSNRWYCFQDGIWVVAQQSPQSSQLAVWQDDSPLDQLSEQAMAGVITFMVYGVGTLPEAVSEPWIPPASFPNLAKPYHTCDLCGAENPYDSRYCNQCGARFGCPKCGSENPPGSRFCNQCGTELIPGGGVR